MRKRKTRKEVIEDIIGIAVTMCLSAWLFAVVVQHLI